MQNTLLPKTINKPKKYFCIFGGGAVRGFSYIGAYKALMEQNIEITGFAGSSVGAFFATFLSLGVTPEEMEEALPNLNFELFKDLNIGFNSGFAISKGGVWLNWLRENMEKYYYRNDYKKDKSERICFKDLKQNLVIIATDLTNCRPYIFSKQLTPDFEVAMAVRISSSMPGLLNPVKIDDLLLCDGDLIKNAPLWRLCEDVEPDTRILEFRLEGFRENKTINSVPDYLNTVYSCMTNYSTDFVIDAFGKNDKYDYIKINTKDLLLVKFNISKNKRQELIDIGYNQTKNYFNINIPEKENILKTVYTQIYADMQTFSKLMQNKKYNESELSLLKIFPLICEYKDVIDNELYNELMKFKNIFDCNSYKNFFGSTKLKNEKFLQACSINLTKKLEKKCSEFS